MTLAPFIHRGREEKRQLHKGAVLVVFVLLAVAGCTMLTWGDDRDTRLRRKMHDAAMVTYGQSLRLLKVAEQKGNWGVEKDLKRLTREAREVAAEMMAPSSYAIRPSDYKGVIEADYDITRPLPHPPTLAHGVQPAFSYPEDNPNTTIGTTPHMLVSYVPRTYFFPSFITPSDAEEVIAKAGSMDKSTVAEYKTTGEKVKNVRTSEGAWLADDTDIAARIKKKVSQVTGLPVKGMENIQVLKYEKGTRYLSHYDYFDPALFGKMPSNRVATFYIFLSEGMGGGELALPMANDGPEPTDMVNCTKGLRVRPVTGNAVLFYGMRPDRHLDHASLHTGCTVTSGVKYSAVIWIQVDGEAYSTKE